MNNATEKLKILLPHWAEHNREHAGEMRRWQAIIEANADVELGQILHQVAALMEQAGELLEDAAEGLGEEAASAVLHNHHH
jgi:hypothetical protein